MSLFEVNAIYKQDANLKREDVAILADWVQKQPHLPETNENLLILFLQSCYYRLEAAKAAIDNFYTVRTLCPELYGFLSEENLVHAINVGFSSMLPKKTPEGYSVNFMKLLDFNAENYIFNHQVNVGEQTQLLHFLRHGPSEGMIALFDTSGFTLGHLARFNLSASKKHLFYIQEAAPVRIKGVHYINVNPMVEKLIGMLRPFMKKELAELMNFHSNMESLYKFVPKSCLPVDYGGESPSVETLRVQREKELLEHRHVFEWLSKQKVDESRRAEKPKNLNEIFGVDGTFKKLEVD